MSKISVLGAGSWGLALAILLEKNGHEVTIWSHKPEEAEILREKRENIKKLPGVIFPESLQITGRLEEAVDEREIIVFAVPSRAVRATAAKVKRIFHQGQIIVDVAKGIEEATLLTPSYQIKEEIPDAEVAVLSGPSHAEEVSRGMPTIVVIGAEKEETAKKLQAVFMNENFRVYTSSDCLGMELGGALKNVIALAAGMADGLGYGDNAKAALITRGIVEMSRLGVAMGGEIESFTGLTGMGDLIVTCASVHSRNRKAGYLMGTGLSPEEAMKEVKMVVEGVHSAKAALALGRRYNLELPIIREVNSILFEEKSPEKAVRDLMMRDGKAEYPAMSWK